MPKRNLSRNVGDDAVHKELGDRMERAGTTTSSLKAKQDSDAQTRFKTTSKQSNNLPLSRVNTLGSGEDSMKLTELMAHCTTLSELNFNSLSIHQMVSLEFCDKHNMVAYLEKSEGSEGFHKIIDFLTDGVRGITATIDMKVKVFVSESSIRRHLKLEDFEGLKTLPTAEIFEQLALMGASKGYFRVDIPLFLTMLIAPESSPSRITSSPSLSPQTHSSTLQPPSTPPSIQPIPTYNAALTKLIKRVKKLEQTIKTNQARRRAKVVISDDEEAEEDPSNQGRSLIKELSFLRSSAKLNLSSSSNLLPSCALVKKNMISEFAEALTRL
ncbi:hypothetical protein Tco_0634087 [Tanacetum coccineum]